MQKHKSNDPIPDDINAYKLQAHQVGDMLYFYP